MKLGFSIKKTKKNTILNHDSNSLNGEKKLSSVFGTVQIEETAPAKHFVSDFNANIQVSTKKEIVIPLIKTNEWKQEEQQKEDKPTKQLTPDEIAAQALLEEARKAQDPDQKNSSSSGSDTSTLVIPMNSATTTSTKKKKEQEKEDEEDKATKQKKEALYALKKKDDTKPNTAAPILRQNVVPGMDELQDVTEKYRHDVSLRPDELDVHSEVYQAIPVEEFGSALLRGMGWKGPSKEQEAIEEDKSKKGFDIKPRHKLLGLGATANPNLMKGKKNNKSHRKEQDIPRQMGLNQPSSKESSAFSNSSKKRSREDEEDDTRGRDKYIDRSRDRGKERDRDRSSRSDRKRSRSRDRSRDRDRDRDRDRSERSDRKRQKSRRSRSRGRDRDRR